MRARTKIIRHASFLLLVRIMGEPSPREWYIKLRGETPFGNRSLSFTMYKFPHVSSRFMDNLEPGSSLSQTSSVEFSRWMDRRRNSTGHVCGIKHTDENIPLSTVAVRLRHSIVREQCAIVPFFIPSLSCVSRRRPWRPRLAIVTTLHGADTGSIPPIGNPIKSKRIAPFIAESYEPHCRLVGGPSIKFACSVNLNYYTVALVDAVCLHLHDVLCARSDFFCFFKCFNSDELNSETSGIVVVIITKWGDCSRRNRHRCNSYCTMYYTLN